MWLALSPGRRIFASESCFDLEPVLWAYCALAAVVISALYPQKTTQFEARMKKIMQADEDVGKISMAVPLLVSDKVPDLGGSDAAGEDCSAAKRRKVSDDDENDSDDEAKRSKMVRYTSQDSGGGWPHNQQWRRKGTVRGRDCGQGSRTVESVVAAHSEKFEDDSEISKHNQEVQILAGKGEDAPIQNFDLNVVLDENGDSTTVAAGSGGSSAEPVPEMKHDEYLGWSLSDLEKMAIDPIQLANLSRRIDEDEEDYDEEG
ncbi:uncharacterized protein LOC122293759 [Carya illinoinensis]|uniref:uncharacterized protein LOC122293759 n=1 Tax=Carya illinoinensis TaxID=32201 RepID=UPI001C7271D4|nr:uncharacterized protein LOC122293759 [Carya illinoinensis]